MTKIASTISFLLLIAVIKGTCQVNADSLFQSSLNHARQNSYAKALADANAALRANPNRAEVMVHIANIYGWQAKFDSAGYYIKRAYATDPKNMDIYDSWLNMLLWSQSFSEIPKTCEIAQNNGYSNGENIAQKMLLAFRGTKRLHEGIAYAEKLEPELLDNPTIKALYNEMYSKTKVKQLSLFYGIDLFDSPDISSKHLTFAEYGFNINRNSLVFRLSYSSWAPSNDLQAEADFYHVFTGGKYLYLNYGYSLNQKLFPAHKAGAEFFFPIAHSLEVSLGGRYLGFKDNPVYILTGQAGISVGASWIALRPFYVKGEKGNSVSTVLTYKYYTGKPRAFWKVDISYGNSPDERYYLGTNAETLRMQGYSIKLEKNIIIGRLNEIKPSVGFGSEETISGSYRSKIMLEIQYKKRF